MSGNLSQNEVFKDIVLIHALPSLHEGSLEILITVPLSKGFTILKFI